MRVRIITIGSEGDVRPYAAFGAALRSAGHHVRVITHPSFETLIRGQQLDFAPVAGDPRQMEDNRRLRDLHDNGRSAMKWWRTFNEVDAPLMRRRLSDCWEACSDADVVVVSILPYLFGHMIARKLDIPLVRAFYFPVSPTRAYPVQSLPRGFSLGGRFNLATYDIQRQLLWTVARPWVAGACREVLGITDTPWREPFGNLDTERQLLLYAYSPSVSPPAPDWGDWIHVTGYWFLDRRADWTPPPELTGFLDSGPPPVYIGGFGSMTNREPAELARIVLRALADTGHRGIVLKGWGGLHASELPSTVFPIEWVPFDWLFPRVAAAVHHGGAGTTAASLRAGVPTVVIPFFLDQFFWGKRVFELGVGPSPILRKNLEADRLAAALRAAPAMKQRAAAIGERIRAENGVACAVDRFQNHFKQKVEHAASCD
ncbi:MAG: glycosyltransferase family 1 protein [Bryobacterales bacterium]|nr:glycosyltransferase family 1 protein [Bryobacterales bacterium]